MNIIITGASKGFGKAIAEKFAANGHHLYICSRNEFDLYKTADELLTRFPEVTVKVRPIDLSIKEQVEEFGKWILNFGISVDVLINNAGIFLPGMVHNEKGYTRKNDRIEFIQRLSPDPRTITAHDIAKKRTYIQYLFNSFFTGIS